MKKVLVAGATGGMGRALVTRFLETGFEVTAFARKLDLLETEESINLNRIRGDMLNKEELLEAAQGMDMLVHAVSFTYAEWEEKHPKALNHLIQASKETGAGIVLIDNVYAYGRQDQPVSESSPKQPHTKKGKIRLGMEEELIASGVPWMVVHLPDLYGPYATNTILFHTLEQIATGKSGNFVGPMNVPREFVYTQDAASAIVELILSEGAFNQHWNIPSIHPISGDELVRLIQEETGYHKKVRSVPPFMIKAMGIFQPFMREVVEMLYLTTDPIYLNGDKVDRVLPDRRRTSYQKGMKETISWIQSRQG